MLSVSRIIKILHLVFSGLISVHRTNFTCIVALYVYLYMSFEQVTLYFCVLPRKNIDLKTHDTVKTWKSSSFITRLPLKSANKRNMVTRINTYPVI